ncbi:MAG: NAD(P)/FAD-dependent oxidoreductase [Parvibaculaceae bacterium]
MTAVPLQDLLIADSLWVRTAGPAADHRQLEGDASCDVAVVGGGLLGLASALNLADLGVAVIVLEAADPGWGGGGRNGGQVNPGLKIDPDEIVRRFGAERGRVLIDFAAAAADEAFATVTKYGIDCDASQTGWLQLAHCAKALPQLERRAGEWRKRGVEVRSLSAAETATLTGSDAYVGGILHPRGGRLHPLKLVRGLARAALARGAVICRHSPVLRLEREGGRHVLVTAQGRVRADRVLLATNAYTDDLMPGLRQSILPVSTVQIASEPLEPALASAILPQGHHASDTHRSLYYFRKDAANRFLIGGRGAYSAATLAGAYAELERIAARIYPPLRGVKWPYRWGGMVAVTEDHLPHFTEPAPGVLAAIGFNGRGVALSVALGRRVAQKLADVQDDALPFPVTAGAPIRCHSLKKAVLPLAASLYGLLDRIDRGKVA